MNRLVLLLIASVLLLPGAGVAAGCSPLSCGPSQFTLASGTYLAVRGSSGSPVRVIDLRTGQTLWRLPPGIVTDGTLVTKVGTLLTWFELARGTRAGDAVLQSRGAFSLVGTSQDASRAVLARTQKRSTTFAIVSQSHQRTVILAGNDWEFDALRGSKLFLIEEGSNGYEVRRYDLAANSLVPKPLKGAGESARITGAPFARLLTPDGRRLFTLYLTPSGGAMIHDLDLVGGKALCIGLPGDGNFGAATTWALALDPDGRTLWAISPAYGRIVAVDIATHSVRQMWRFTAGDWNGNASGVAVISPDGSHFAVSDAQHVWFLSLEPHVTVSKVAHVATALGWAPDQSRLWVVGARSRVSSLAFR